MIGAQNQIQSQNPSFIQQRREAVSTEQREKDLAFPPEQLKQLDQPFIRKRDHENLEKFRTVNPELEKEYFTEIPMQEPSRQRYQSIPQFRGEYGEEKKQQSILKPEVIGGRRHVISDPKNQGRYKNPILQTDDDSIEQFEQREQQMGVANRQRLVSREKHTSKAVAAGTGMSGHFYNIISHKLENQGPNVDNRGGMGRKNLNFHEPPTKFQPPRQFNPQQIY